MSDAIQTRFVPSSDGVEVALHDLGGSGPPLLIAHATGFHGMAYTPLSRHLTDRYSVWALDMRGHGATLAPESGDFAWSGMADDLMACVGVIGGPVFAVGHSMGGAAILLAERSNPGTITSGYVFEPIVLPDHFTIGKNDNSMGARARRRRDSFDSKADVLERYGSRPPLSLLDPEALSLYVEFGFREVDDGTVTLTCTPEHEARTFEAPDKPHAGELGGIAAPMMIAAGREDGDMSPAHFAGPIVEGLSHAELKRYDELTHFGPLEDPRVVAQDIIAWFDRT